MQPQAKPPEAKSSATDFLAGGGEMGRLIRAYDWSVSPLGSPETWPQSLRSALSICLHSSFPTAIYWGPELRLLYNDAWAHIPAERHPWALGRPAQEVWADIWHVIGPQFAEILASGEGFAAFDQMLPMERDGTPRQTYWNYSFTPIRGEDGAIVGVFNQGHEVTDRVLGERRLALRIQLEERLRGLSDPQAIIAEAQEALGRHLGANRVGYGDVDATQRYFTTTDSWTDGTIPPYYGTHDLAAFGPAVLETMRRGEALLIRDARTDPRTAAPDMLRAFEALQFTAAITATLIKDGRLRAAIYVHARDPHQWTDADAALVQEIAERIWSAVERAQAEAARRESEDRFRNMADHAPIMMWVTDPRGACTYLNRSWYEFTGQSVEASLGLGWLAAVHPDDRGWSGQTFLEANRRREAFRLEYRLRHADGTYRWAIDAAAPRFAEDGAFLGFIGSVFEITERKRAEEHQQLLINELNHRVKNTLATVQSIAGQTLRTARSPAEAQEAFESRLLALSRTHDVLTRESWEGAGLYEIVAQAVEPYSNIREDRLHLDGPNLRVAPRMALALAMALQELATNAAKYGALSNAAGEIRIAWSVTADESGAPRLDLRWRESGGPPVAPPKRRGFGSRLIERSLAHDLDARVAIDFAPTGVVCTVNAPLT